MTNKTTLTSEDKVIIIMGILDLGAMLANVTGRLSKAGGLTEEENSAIRNNIVNIQSLLTSILDTEPRELAKAAEMSQMISEHIVPGTLMVKLAMLMKELDKDDDDDTCDFNGLMDLLN